MTAPTPLIHVIPTIFTLSPFDYILNRYLADNIKNKTGQHAVQLISYFTHPADLAIKGIVLPLLLLANPFITVGINIKNKNGVCFFSTLLIPVKLIVAIPAIAGFEAQIIVKGAWSLLGGNTCVNVIKGKKQTNAFFLKRIYQDRFSEFLSFFIRRQWPHLPLGLTPKRVYSFPKLYIPKDYQSGNSYLKDLKEKDLFAWLKDNDVTFMKMRKVYDKIICGLYFMYLRDDRTGEKVTFQTHPDFIENYINILRPINGFVRI